MPVTLKSGARLARWLGQAAVFRGTGPPPDWTAANPPKHSPGWPAACSALFLYGWRHSPTASAQGKPASQKVYDLQAPSKRVGRVD